ncbi:hypothetical protein D7Y21_28020 [Corallococcus sp. AB045]|uniref:IPT/TIG domain-containing protein n=1 Tax=Corallococcus sp. AB045 TaxID=2316719 RepID=UPI000ECBC132|nr:IPT/TIG domain-containing protein [Corallococcus sp. AB045]RKH82626.1 hypothetical protein D7Y21_28020 [Corallococcus sp. AB045]
MPSPIQKVNPGDLVTSEFMNHLLDRIDNLEERVARIEAEGAASGAVVILDILPEGIVRVGDEMRLIGRNFGLLALNVVTVAGKRIEQFTSGSDSLIVFNAPTVPGIKEEGQPVQLTLSNPRGLVTQTIILADRPPTVLVADILLSLATPPDRDLMPDGTTYSFVFDLTAFTNMDETFILKPTLDLGWPVAVVGPAGAAPTAEFPIPEGKFPEGTKRSVTVQVTIPTTVGLGTQAHLVLTASSKRSPQISFLKSELLSVGEAGPVPSAFPVTLGTVRPPAERKDEFVQLPADASATVQFKADLPNGEYLITLSIPDNPGSLWTIASAMTPPDTITVQQQPGLVTLSTRLTSKTGAQPTDLKVRVQSKTEPNVFGELTQRIRLKSP